MILFIKLLVLVYCIPQSLLTGLYNCSDTSSYHLLEMLLSLSTITDIAAHGTRSLLPEVIHPEEIKKLCSKLVRASEFAPILAGIYRNQEWKKHNWLNKI